MSHSWYMCNAYPGQTCEGLSWCYWPRVGGGSLLHDSVNCGEGGVAHLHAMEQVPVKVQ